MPDSFKVYDTDVTFCPMCGSKDIVVCDHTEGAVVRCKQCFTYVIINDIDYHVYKDLSDEETCIGCSDWCNKDELDSNGYCEKCANLGDTDYAEP